jgi:hypothetical protein
MGSSTNRRRKNKKPAAHKADRRTPGYQRTVDRWGRADDADAAADGATKPEQNAKSEVPLDWRSALPACGDLVRLSRLPATPQQRGAAREYPAGRDLGSTRVSMASRNISPVLADALAEPLDVMALAAAPVGAEEAREELGRYRRCCCGRRPRLAVAPMMAWTDHHYRTLARMVPPMCTATRLLSVVIPHAPTVQNIVWCSACMLCVRGGGVGGSLPPARCSTRR